MSELMRTDVWRERRSAALRAIIVVACYLIVFAGLLYTVAGAASP